MGSAASSTAARLTATRRVTILGAFGGAEAEAFEASLAPFEQESGIEVQYTPDPDFTTTVKQKVNSGDAPDIGLFPQPGGLLEFAGQDKVNPIDTYLDYERSTAPWCPGFLDSARYRGRVYGAPMRIAVKSLVWYPKRLRGRTPATPPSRPPSRTSRR